MKKILFPTDFSKAAENAFHFAVALAKSINAKIDLVNVYHLPFADAANVPTEYVEEMLEEKCKLVLQRLKEFIGLHGAPWVEKQMAVYGLFIPTEIQGLVEENGYELVIMGTRGEHHSQMQKILGSVTTHTMLQAPCPVLAVPEEAKWKKIERIAYATNFEPKDAKVSDKLMALAGELQAEVHFVHVETKPGIGNMQDFISLKNYPFAFTEFAIVNNPSVLEGLDQYIKEKNIGLLALLSPERRLWEKLFHSSFTKRLAFHSKTPILVFKA